MTPQDKQIEKLEKTIKQMANQTAQLRLNVRALLEHLGAPSRCKGCNAEIWWIRTRAGNRAPYTAAAINHFADCPQAELFRRKE